MKPAARPVWQVLAAAGGGITLIVGAFLVLSMVLGGDGGDTGHTLTPEAMATSSEGTVSGKSPSPSAPIATPGESPSAAPTEHEAPSPTSVQPTETPGTTTTPSPTPSLTPQPTRTNTPLPASTPTPTRTATATPTKTPSPTATSTPSPTPSPTATQALPATVSGIVTLPDFGACDGCTIRFISDATQAVATSSASGAYSVVLPPGTYAVEYRCITAFGTIWPTVESPVTVTLSSGTNNVNIVSGFCY